jgi:hypothetical protein
VSGLIVEEEAMCLHPIGYRVCFCTVRSNLAIVDSACSTPLGVVGIEISHNDCGEARADLGKEICDCMGSARGIEIVNGKCRASGEGNACSKKRIRVGKNNVGLHTW